MKAEVEQAKTLGQHDLDLLLLATLLRRYDEILKEGYQANPPPPAPKKSEHNKRKPGRAKQSPARNLLDRFSQRKQAVLRFLFDFAVPFDNNQAERDLRMSHPSSKKSPAAFAARRGSSCFVAFAATSQHCENRGLSCYSLSKRLFLDIPFFPLLHDPTE
jgi:transposase